MGKATMRSKPRVNKNSEIFNHRKARKGGNNGNGNGNKKPRRKKEIIIELSLSKPKPEPVNEDLIGIEINSHQVKGTKGKGPKGKGPKEVTFENKNPRKHTNPNNIGDAMKRHLESEHFPRESIREIIYKLVNKYDDLIWKFKNERRKTRKMFLFIRGTKVSVLEKIRSGVFEVLN